MRVIRSMFIAFSTYHYPDFDDTRIHTDVPTEEPVKSKRGRKPKTKE